MANYLKKEKKIKNPSQYTFLTVFSFYLPVLHHQHLSVLLVAGDPQRAEHLHDHHQQQHRHKLHSLHRRPRNLFVFKVAALGQEKLPRCGRMQQPLYREDYNEVYFLLRRVPE